jgi:hypothetical protein
MKLENLMSNEIKSGNMNDPSPSTTAPKSGQQSQGTTPQTDKAPLQSGGSDHKSGQQSQGDPMKTAGITQKSGQQK